MNPEPKCAKCGGEMDRGFVADQLHFRTEAARWVKGNPRPGFLPRSIKTDGIPQFEIESYRCKQCGHLESYAKKPKLR